MTAAQEDDNDVPPPLTPEQAGLELVDGQWVKTRARLRQEALFLLPWRMLLLGAVVWDAYYAWLGYTLPYEELDRLALETSHSNLQFGVTLFLGFELTYYTFISWSFRRWRDPFMVVAAIGVLVLAANLRFRF